MGEGGRTANISKDSLFGAPPLRTCAVSVAAMACRELRLGVKEWSEALEAVGGRDCIKTVRSPSPTPPARPISAVQPPSSG
jgi:hypothetical protein